jgi:hypothetical protein
MQPDKIRIKLRTKVGTPISENQLQNREFIFTDVEKNLVYKSYNTNNLYKFSPTDDDNISIYTTWSSDKISSYLSANYAEIDHFHEYYDLLNIPDKSILFTSSGIGLPPSNPCSPPEVTGDSNNIYWKSSFTQEEVGFYNFMVPYDYTGLVKRVVITYSCDEESIWEIEGQYYQNDSNYNSSTSTETLSFTVDALESVNKIGIMSFDVTSNILGDGTNKNRMILLKLKLLSDTECDYIGMRFDY